MLFCLVGITSGVYGLKSSFHGPNWAEAYDRSRKLNISEIDIWPPGVKIPVNDSGKFRLSAGYDVGGASLISVNRIDISPNQRGVNVVSVDYAKKLFLVRAFDTFGVVY